MPYAYPLLPITMAEALALPEYSCSQPTGATIGKRWRRHDGSHDQRFLDAGGKPRWLICEYAESEKGPEWVKTLVFRPLIRVKADSRPTTTPNNDKPYFHSVVVSAPAQKQRQGVGG